MMTMTMMMTNRSSRAPRSCVFVCALFCVRVQSVIRDCVCVRAFACPVRLCDPAYGGRRRRRCRTHQFIGHRCVENDHHRSNVQFAKYATNPPPPSLAALHGISHASIFMNNPLGNGLLHVVCFHVIAGVFVHSDGAFVCVSCGARFVIAPHPIASLISMMASSRSLARVLNCFFVG
uniref:Putative secreted protein n=1 Tax=Anopheles triannulatus TaxID=58253 RepID=A0A2M4B499_9DIPT